MNRKPAVAIVTGANRGIGLEVCRQLAANGFIVLLGSRDLGNGRTAAARLPNMVKAVELDVANIDHPARLARVIQKEYGRVDVLANNAGVHYDSDETATTADWRIIREAFEVNLFGAWRMAQAVTPMMRAEGYGRIVNVSSQAGSLSTMSGGTPAYSTSKAALNALTRVLAGELAGSGVLVNAVCPGWVATDMGGAGGRPVAEGAAGIVWAAMLPAGGPTGGFFRDGMPLPW
ncbi:MAG TPA: SDR family NAD(P)-dependent oxidoreductase, partial [Vicinamibacterales bacterium]|nr:SDR family NAD(P)-dependent oxidoreductase [Vicinamibacterales bacterium]